VTVRLDPEDVAWLDAASDDKGGIGRAEVLRRLVETQRCETCGRRKADHR